jgi:hypothetical protein
MEISSPPEQRGLPQAFMIPRGFLIFMIVASGWSLYSMLRHVSTRFEVPHRFVNSFDLFGRAGIVIDLCTYLYVTWLGFLFVRLARVWLERVWVTCWIGQILINPLKMLIPQHSFVVWWIELSFAMVLFLATVALFLQWKPNQNPRPMSRSL